MKPSRGGRVLLFAGAIILPSAVLLAATVRLALQERELEERRREERRTLLAASIAQELLTRLGQLRSQVLQVRPNPSAMTVANPALVLVAQVRAGRLVFPWEASDPGTRRQEGREYSQLMAEGEAAEFVKAQFAEAAALYSRAAQHASDSVHRGQAWLREARAVARAGRDEPARERYRKVATLPSSLRDDDGMPLALYAAEGLLQTRFGGEEEAGRTLRGLTATIETLGPTALYALRDLASRVDTALEQIVASWLATTERVRTLEHALPGLRAVVSGDGGGATPTAWFPFGPEPWLVSAQPASEAGGAIVVVTAPAALLRSLAAENGPLAGVARSIRLTAAGEQGAEDLGPALPGLRAVFTDAAVLGTSGSRLGSRLFLFVLPVVAGLTLFGTWLFWQDLRRETAIAELRSQIVSGVSHELKTPLTSIRMFAETLLLGRPR